MAPSTEINTTLAKFAGIALEATASAFVPTPLAKGASVAAEAVATRGLTKFTGAKRNGAKVAAAFRMADDLFSKAADQAGFAQVATLPLGGLESLTKEVNDVPDKLDFTELVAIIRHWLAVSWEAFLQPEDLDRLAVLYLDCLYKALAAKAEMRESISFVMLQELLERQRKLEADLASRPDQELRRSMDEYLRAIAHLATSEPYLALDYILQTGGALRNSYAGYISPKLALLPLSHSDNQAPHRLSIRDIFAVGSRSPRLVLGQAGVGKSSLVRYLAARSWSDPESVGLPERHLPLPIRLRWLPEPAISGSVESQIQTALAHDPDWTALQAPPPGFFANWPRVAAHPWLVLLDGLDEIPGAHQSAYARRIAGWLDELLQAGHQVVLTTRESAVPSFSSVVDRCTRFELLPFDVGQQRDFAHAVFGDADETFLQSLDAVRVGTLAGTPLLLGIAARVTKADGHLPEPRSSLYCRFVDILLEEAQPGIRREVGDRLAVVARAALREFARAMTEEPSAASQGTLRRLGVDFLMSALGFSKTEAQSVASTFVEVLARRSGLLFSIGGSAQWLHESVREYLTAAALANSARPNSPEAVQMVRNWNVAGWRDVILFLLGIWSTECELPLEVAPDVTGLLDLVLDGTAEAEVFAGEALAQGAHVDQQTYDSIVTALGKVLRLSSSGSPGEKNFLIFFEPCIRILSALAPSSRTLELLTAVGVRSREDAISSSDIAEVIRLLAESGRFDVVVQMPGIYREPIVDDELIRDRLQYAEGIMRRRGALELADQLAMLLGDSTQ